MRGTVLFVVILCGCGQGKEEFVAKKKAEQLVQVEGKVADSEQLFLNLGFKKRWKDTRSKLENAIFKSRIEVLGDILRTRVHILKGNGYGEVDLIFLVDSSSSVGEENFASELKFVRKVVSDFRVGPEDTRVAIITFSTNVVTHVNHLEVAAGGVDHEKCSLLHHELPAIKYSGGNTFTLGALLEAQRILNASRPEAKRALFLVTDGFSNNGAPLPVAQQLKDAGVIMFTFGIKSGNVEELYQMSSVPAEEHSFLLESFSEFEALARRALHQDLKSRGYMKLKNRSLCDHLCSSSNLKDGCCVGNSSCSCGTLSGHFVCLCPPGYYGSGLAEEGCSPCPHGTYNDGSVPGDVLACKQCPDRNHVTLRVAATAATDCKCKEGFVASGMSCKVITCPKLSPPTNGFFVKAPCSNVLHAACGVRCNIGYELIGSSVRLCQTDGSWSGVTPTCAAKRCQNPRPVANSEMRCRNEEEQLELVVEYDSEGGKRREVVKTTPAAAAEDKQKKVGKTTAAAEDKQKKVGKTTVAAEDKQKKVGKTKEFNFTIDTQCNFSCLLGYSLVGSRQRTCLPVTRWGGLQTTCKAITCPSLPPVTHGNILPAACVAPTHKVSYNTLCHVTCRPGYLLKGPAQRNCTGKYGTWTAKNTPNRCLDVEPPRIDCPWNKTVQTDERSPFATVMWRLPNVTDNSGEEPIVWSRPSTEDGQPVKLSIGTTLKVEIHAVDAAGNAASCSFYVAVEDKEPPSVEGCESPPTAFLSSPRRSDLDWTPPTFTDNSEHVTVSSSHTSLLFPLGTTPVTYKGADRSGNSAHCVLNVTMLGSQTPEEVIQTGTIEMEASCESTTDLSNEILREMVDVLGSETLIVTTDVRCGDVELVEEETNVIGGRSNRRRRGIVKRKVSVKFSVFGRSTNYLNPHDVLDDMETSKKRLTKNFAKVGNRRKWRVKSVVTAQQLNFTCPTGTLPRGDLCVNCPAGTFYNLVNLTCSSCPVGEFQSLEGQLSCLHCQDGFSTRKPHSRTASDCRLICPPGWRGRKRRYNVLALSPCARCAVGQYQPAAGRTSCLNCPPGTSTWAMAAAHPDKCVDQQELLKPCARHVCLNNGTCVVDKGFPSCDCRYPYVGAFCERVVDACASSPCANGATCLNVAPGQSHCACAVGYTGKQCDEQKSHCESQPCVNGAACTDIFNGFHCDCSDGFYGMTCKDNIDDCGVESPCLNNGTCNDLIRGYMCSCHGGHRGAHCEQEPITVDQDIALDRDTPCVEGVTCGCGRGFHSSNCSQRLERDVLLKYSKCSVTEYMAVDLTPQDLTRVSLCLWVQTTDNFNYGTLVSYATLDMDNAFTLTDYNGFVLYVHGERVITDVTANDGQWHFVCATWQSVGGLWRVYLDGIMMAAGVGLADGIHIQGGGKLVVGQEQDLYGGGFNEVESFVGKMAYLEVWDRVLTQTEIIKMNQNCEPYSGSLVTWETFLSSVHGNLQMEPSMFCKDCPRSLDTLFRGNISIHTRADGSVRARYQCDEGYLLNFDLPGSDEEKIWKSGDWWERTCTKPGVWQPRVPRCVRVSCGFPGYFPHGRVQGKSYLYADAVHYQCDLGYTMRGVATRICEADGSWNHDKPYCHDNTTGVCPLLDPPINGSWRSSMMEGDIQRKAEVEVVCHPGHRIVGPRILTCFSGGVWDKPPPLCVLITCSLPEGTSTWTPGTEQKRTYQVKESIQVVCIGGTGNETPTLQCSEEGAWNITTAMCTVACRQRPRHPDHGYVLDDGRYPAVFSVGETVLVTCRHGYILQGDDSTTCSEQGLWVQEQPTSCTPIECGEPPTLPHTATLPVNLTYYYGHRLTYKCSPGFQNYGDMFVRCEAEVRWSKIKGKCVRISCGKPTLPLTAYSIGSTFLYEETVGVMCSGSAENITCQADRRWHPQLYCA